MSLSQSERAKRRKEIREYADANGAIAASNQFSVSLTTVYHSGFRRSKESQIKQQTFVILKRLINGESPASLSKQFQISRQRVNEIKQLAIDAGFTELTNRR